MGSSLSISGGVGSTVESVEITDGTIVNADVNASAAIAGTKINEATTSERGTTEAAIASEVNTGTDAVRFVSPDSLAGSNAGTRLLALVHTASDTAVATGDGTDGLPITAELNGMDVVDVTAFVETKGITGTTDVQIRRARAGTDADVLSTKVTIGDEFFASDGSVNTANDDLQTGDLLFVDVDAVHSGTAPNGLTVVIHCRLP